MATLTIHLPSSKYPLLGTRRFSAENLAMLTAVRNVPKRGYFELGKWLEL